MSAKEVSYVDEVQYLKIKIFYNNNIKNEITEQKDRNHAKVQAQGKSPIKIQIMAIFLKKNNFNSKLSHFQIKNILVKNLRKIFVKIF